MVQCTLTGFDTFFALDAVADAVAERVRGRNLPLYHHDGFTETMERVEAQIGRMKWCKETCFYHATWARFDFQTTRFDVLQRRIALTQAKLDRLVARYTASKGE